MNQTGSQSRRRHLDGPGYNFLDGAEVTNGLNHDFSAFVRSRDGQLADPNSNGSGKSSSPPLSVSATSTEYYIVFGSVPEDDDVREDGGQVIHGSRDVVDPRSTMSHLSQSAVQTKRPLPTSPSIRSPFAASTVNRRSPLTKLRPGSSNRLPPVPTLFNFTSSATSGQHPLDFSQPPGTSFVIHRFLLK